MFVGGIVGSFDCDCEVAEVVGVGSGGYAGYGVSDEALCFLMKMIMMQYNIEIEEILETLERERGKDLLNVFFLSLGGDGKQNND